MVKISFVVPVYNKGVYLAECLSSLVHQTLKDIEIVVVDDCSTDNSREIISYYAEKHSNITPAYLDKNVGRSSARNYGNRIAKGKIIAVMDADDFSVPERAEKIYKFFSRHSDTTTVFSSYYICDAMSKIGSVIPACKFDINELKRTFYTFIGHSTMAYRKSGRQYKDGKPSEYGIDDWCYQIDTIVAKEKIGFIQEPLVVYRNLPDGIVQTRDNTKVMKYKKLYLKKAGIL